MNNRGGSSEGGGGDIVTWLRRPMGPVITYGLGGGGGERGILGLKR